MQWGQEDLVELCWRIVSPMNRSAAGAATKACPSHIPITPRQADHATASLRSVIPLAKVGQVCINNANKASAVEIVCSQKNRQWAAGSSRPGTGHCQRLDKNALSQSTTQAESAIAYLADHGITARDDADGPPFEQAELPQSLILTEFPCAHATDPVRSIALNRSQWQYVRRHPPYSP
jgi:hypothetical protein